LLVFAAGLLATAATAATAAGAGAAEAAGAAGAARAQTLTAAASDADTRTFTTITLTATPAVVDYCRSAVLSGRLSTADTGVGNAATLLARCIRRPACSGAPAAPASRSS
jgi:hypothetical protein